jgi:aminoglycoside phosphotransferase (APT) family kinase protein
MIMEIPQLIARINDRHHTDFTLQHRYATGENQGAYALTTPTGELFVLKWNRRPTWLHSVRRAAQITTALAEHHIPVPRYLLADAFDDSVTYWIQTALPGAPPTPLRYGHVTQVCAFVDVQAGRAISSEADWSAYVLAVVFQGESGWRDSLERYSTATREVLARLTDLVAGTQTFRLRRDDIVHGDLGPDNLLVVGDRVSGIVDWDAAGCGDRSLDLSKQLFYAYDDLAIRADLWARIVAISGRSALDILLAYNILAQLDWSIHHHAASAVDTGVVLAERILQDAATT